MYLKAGFDGTRRKVLSPESESLIAMFRLDRRVRERGAIWQPVPALTGPVPKIMEVDFSGWLEFGSTQAATEQIGRANPSRNVAFVDP
jgi:FAD/FMN-containing dehydrogenase